MTFTYQDALKKLRDKEPFAFSRYGDGEWNAILGRHGHNTDGHEYFPSLGAALREVLDRRGNYIKAMQPKAVNDMGMEIWQYTSQCQLPEPKDWPNADIFHDANKETWLKELFEVLGGHYSVVGNWPLVLYCADNNKRFVNNRGHWYVSGVTVPRRNAWLAHDVALNAILTRQDITDRPVLFCAGMMSNVLIDELWWMHPEGTYIDLGSALDPHAGIASRRYHKEMIEKGRP